MATPNHCSSSSQSQPLNPFAQQLHSMLDSQWSLHLSSQRNASPRVPFFISGDATTSPHQDTISHERIQLPTFHLNYVPSEFDVGIQGDIPPRIRLTQLKRFARAKKVELKNPVQKNEWKNKVKDSCAGSEENLDDSSQQQVDALSQVFFSDYAVQKKEQISRWK